MICAAVPRRSRRRGGALVELAMVLPMLLILTIGLLEFGLVGLRHMALTGAVRAGVDYAFQYDDSAGTERVIRSAAGNSAAVVTSNRWCECAGATVVCGGVCAGNIAQQVYVRVAVSEIYIPIFINVEMIESLLGPSKTLSSSATFRIQ
jgi:Flp pilus assembly protein TadG